MTRRLLLLTIFLAATHALQARKWTPDEVRDVIRKVNTYWQENNKAEVRSFWDNAAYHTGNMEVYKLLKDEHLLDYSVRWADHNRWMGAQEPDASKWKYKTYGEGQDYVLFGDWQICFQTYIDLYLLEERGERREERIARAKEVMGYEADSRAHDYWWWADALYMVMPVMTKMYQLTGDEKYLDKLYENLLYSDSIMLDEETGLVSAVDGRNYTLGGLIESINTRITRKGENMAILSIEDLYGSMEVIVFPQAYERYRSLLEVNNAVIIKGRAQVSDDESKLIASDIYSMESFVQKGNAESKELWVLFKNQADYMKNKGDFETVLGEHRGFTPVYVQLGEEKKGFRCPANVDLDTGIEEALILEYGRDRVLVRVKK